MVFPSVDCAPANGWLEANYKHVFKICSQEAIEELLSSGNIDNPEGGLDALIQVAACEKVGK